MGAGVAVAGALTEPPLVVAGLFLLGVGHAGSQLARYAGAELYPASRKGFALGAVVWAGTIGAVGGPAMLAPTAAVADVAGLPPLTGAFLLALVAAGAAGLVTTGVHRSATPVPRGGQAKTPPQLLATPTIRIALVSMVVSHVVMVALMVAAPAAHAPPRPWPGRRGGRHQPARTRDVCPRTAQRLPHRPVRQPSAAAVATFTSTQLLAVGGCQLLATVSVTLVAVTLLSIARARVAPDRHAPDLAITPRRRSR